MTYSMIQLKSKTNTKPKDFVEASNAKLMIHVFTTVLMQLPATTIGRSATTLIKFRPLIQHQVPNTIRQHLIDARTHHARVIPNARSIIPALMEVALGLSISATDPHSISSLMMTLAGNLQLLTTAVLGRNVMLTSSAHSIVQLNYNAKMLHVGLELATSLMYTRAMLMIQRQSSAIALPLTDAFSSHASLTVIAQALCASILAA